MTNLSIIIAFNNLLDKFLEYIENNFTELSSEMKLTRTAIEFVKKSNPCVIMKKFMEGIKPYKSEILACNELFFLEHMSGLKTALDTNEIVFTDKLRDIWINGNISEIQKANIFLFLIKMIKLDEI